MSPDSRFRMLTSMTLGWLIVLGTTSLAEDARNAGRTVVPLWPDGVPGAEHQDQGDIPELIITKAKSNQPTPAIVILPGGGYHMRAIDHEGYQIADWMAELGITSAICTYRVRGAGNAGKGYGHPYPMMDAQRAIQTVRANAKRLQVSADRIGVIGFSAGGHLASTVSTHFAEASGNANDAIAKVSSRPDFAILCYPVISLHAEFTHRGSGKNLLGPNPPEELLRSLSNETQVSSETPPTFLFHTGEDKVVPVENSLAYYQACLRAGVPAELHVFPAGRHGVGLARELQGAQQWPELCAQWLQRVTSP